MACVALASLMGTIELEFLKPNHRVCVDDEKPFKSLFDKLSSLEEFLVKEYDNWGAPNRDVEIKIRDFALKAEDAIEVQVRNIVVATQHKANGELHRTLQQVARDTEELLNIINNPSSTNEVDNHSFPLIRWSQPDLHPHNIASGGSLQCSPELHDIIMIGHQSEFSWIREFELLYNIYPTRSIISIRGVPGIGKTTLCKKLYADERVVSYFQIQAWLTIPPPRQEYNVQQLLCNLLQSMRPSVVNEIDMENTTVFQLKDQLYGHLKDKRYLIVLDDVYNTLLWDDIQQCFPNDSNGSRILLTTSFHHVAKYTIPFRELSFLGKSESWDLFCHRFSCKQYMAPEFEKIAKCLVEECQGLPRSIVMVAERLSKCNYTLKEWKKVKKELLSLGTLYADTQHLSKLTDIYNQLPQHLKLCFLHLAVFPKGIDFATERLIMLWVAEGFVKPIKGEPLEYIAFTYIKDLRRRGLILDKFRTTSAKMTYYMHNDMHSFCVREAQKEGLLCAVNTRQCIGWPLEVLANSCRWLSLRSHSLDYHMLFSSNIPRSLFFFPHGYFEMFVPFKHLRILDFSESLILKRRVSFPLGGLVFLRYISIPQWFEGLDDVISSNSNLQTLIVSGDESKPGAPTLPFPSKIWELQQLRHLEVGNMYMVDPPNMVKENLQTLCCAMPIHFRRQVYCKFPSIRKLKVVYKDVLEACCSRLGNPIITLENIEDLIWLETLSVIIPVGSITLLERLVFPANLKKLRLSGTNFAVKALKVIGELPVLEDLKLENAFYGRVWEVEGGFYELKYLVLEAKNLERWVANASCFKCLIQLVLKRCYFLEEIPPIIAKSPLYWSIDLEKCPLSVVSSAKWIQQQKALKIQMTPRIIVDGEIFD